MCIFPDVESAGEFKLSIESIDCAQQMSRLYSAHIKLFSLFEYCAQFNTKLTVNVNKNHTFVIEIDWFRLHAQLMSIQQV